MNDNSNQSKRLIRYRSGSFYEGELNVANQRHGFGSLQHPNFFYEGKFSNNKRHGAGKITFSN